MLELVRMPASRSVSPSSEMLLNRTFSLAHSRQAASRRLDGQLASPSTADCRHPCSATYVRRDRLCVSASPSALAPSLVMRLASRSSSTSTGCFSSRLASASAPVAEMRLLVSSA